MQRLRAQLPDPQVRPHRQAVNALSDANKMPTSQNIISKSDPLLQKGKTITADPASITEAIDGKYSDCKTETITKDPEYTIQTCEDYADATSNSCTVGVVVDVDADFIYQCVKTLSTQQSATCTIGQVVKVDTDYNYQCVQTVSTLQSATCTIGQVVQVDADYNYQCDRTVNQVQTSTCTIGQVVVVDADYNYQCVNKLATQSNASCTIGQVVVVDRDYNYQCVKSPAKLSTQTCNKTLVVTPVTTPGCTVGSLITRIVGDPCPGCVDYVVYEFYCAATGYTLTHYGQVKSSQCFYTYVYDRYPNPTVGGYYYACKNGGDRIDQVSVNVPGGPGVAVPKTLDIDRYYYFMKPTDYINRDSRYGMLYCTRQYHAQSCSGGNCTISVWWENPCQGTSYQYSNTFPQANQTTYVDSWNDQCGTLASRS
ncbi:MAG: hypothetical protein IPG34_16435 [Rhodocyclaceae bacterium]|nr:hypothetical protein [Rhodocyclaceae bacterium]